MLKLEDQVISLQQAKKLKELGVNQDSLSYWCWNGGYYEDDGSPAFTLTNENWGWEEVYAAFSVAELGELLPQQAKSMKTCMENGNMKWICGPIFPSDKEDNVSVKFKRFIPPHYGATEAQVRAEMLISLIKLNLIPMTHA